VLAAYPYFNAFLKYESLISNPFFLSDPQGRSILHLTPPITLPTSCAFLLLDLKSMIQILRKYESTDVLRAHDTFSLFLILLDEQVAPCSIDLHERKKVVRVRSRWLEARCGRREVRGSKWCDRREVRNGPSLRARRLRHHGFPLDRVLAVVPGARVHACACCHLRIPLLGRSGPPGHARCLGRTHRARLAARAAWVQPCLQHRRRLDALRCRQRWLQRHRRLALQHPAQHRPALGLRCLVLSLQLLVPKRVFKFRLHLCGIEKCKCCGGDFLSPSLWLPKVFIRTKTMR
jgi:hypothetical protein